MSSYDDEEHRIRDYGMPGYDGGYGTDGLPPLDYDPLNLNLDPQPTIRRPGRQAPPTKLCLNPWCLASIPRESHDICPACEALWFAMSDLRTQVWSGERTDFPSGEKHLHGMNRKPLVGWQRVFPGIVMNACYALRWTPWLDHHYRGFDNQQLA